MAPDELEQHLAAGLHAMLQVQATNMLGSMEYTVSSLNYTGCSWVVQ